MLVASHSIAVLNDTVITRRGRQRLVDAVRRVWQFDRSSFRGAFADKASLEAAVVTPSDGDIAFAGTRRAWGVAGAWLYDAFSTENGIPTQDPVRALRINDALLDSSKYVPASGESGVKPFDPPFASSDDPTAVSATFMFRTNGTDETAAVMATAVCSGDMLTGPAWNVVSSVGLASLVVLAQTGNNSTLQVTMPSGGEARVRLNGRGAIRATNRGSVPGITITASARFTHSNT